MINFSKLDGEERRVYSMLFMATMRERIIFHSVSDMISAALDGNLGVLKNFIEDRAWPDGNESVLSVSGEPVEVRPEDLRHLGFFHKDSFNGDTDFARPESNRSDPAMKQGLEYFARHPGNVEKDDWRDGDPTRTKPEGAFPKELEPMTTKAGQKIFGITFAAPADTKAEGLSTPSPRKIELHARHPMNFLIRVDTARQRLIYDAFEGCSAPINVMKSLPSQRSYDFGAQCIGLPMQGQYSAVNSDSDDFDFERTPVRLLHGSHFDARRTAWAVPAANSMLSERLFRLAMPLEDLSGIRLHCPNAERRACLILEWSATPGMHQAENVRAGWTTKPIKERWRIDSIEKVVPGAFVPFAVRNVHSEHKKTNSFVACGDWTEDETASKATRHYIYGTVEELKEVAAMLATISPVIAKMLSKEGMKDKSVNSLADADLSPSAARQPLEEMKQKAKPRRNKITPKKRKKGQAYTVDEVNDALRKCGVPDSVLDSRDSGHCMRRAWLVGAYPLPTCAADLDEEVCSGECEGCDGDISCTFREALEQEDYGGNSYEEGGEGGAMPCEECGNICFATQLCTGQPVVNGGKFHNHCTLCPDFGECMGDYRTAHCEACGNHWFCGLSGFKCTKCGGDGRPIDTRTTHRTHNRDCYHV